MPLLIRIVLPVLMIAFLGYAAPWESSSGERVAAVVPVVADEQTDGEVPSRVTMLVEEAQAACRRVDEPMARRAWARDLRAACADLSAASDAVHDRRAPAVQLLAHVDRVAREAIEARLYVAADAGGFEAASHRYVARASALIDRTIDAHWAHAPELTREERAAREAQILHLEALYLAVEAELHRSGDTYRTPEARDRLAGRIAELVHAASKTAARMQHP